MTTRKAPVRILAALAIAAAMTLSGCDFFSQLQLPFELPQIDLPEIDLSGIGIDLTPTSVEEAEQSRQEATVPEVSSPTVVQEGYLTVGIDTTAGAPLYIAGSSGEATGMDVDIAAALAQELGLKVRFVELQGSSDAAAATCDVVMAVSSKSSGGLTVVGGYAENAIAFFHRGEQTVVSAGDLGGMTVGVQSGSASQRELEKSGASVSVQEFANLNEAFDALDAGTVDYVLCDAYSGAYLAAIHPGIACAGTIDDPSAIGIGVASGNAELQTAVQGALEEISTNGVMGIVRSRWIGSMGNLGGESRVQGLSS